MINKKLNPTKKGKITFVQANQEEEKTKIPVIIKKYNKKKRPREIITLQATQQKYFNNKIKA